MKIKKKSNAVRVPPVQKAIRIKRKSTDTTEESTLSKAIENFKKVFEEKKDKPIRIISAPKDVVLPKIVKSTRKINKVPDVTPKGLIYIGHIPHGFYEDEMKEYFSQFGKVTRVRVARSKNTGKSRGYGYVEFLHPDVAKVAAETMNNYLMCGRLLKAICIPPEKQHGRHFLGKPWSTNKYPKKINRQKVIKSRNGIIDDNEHRNFVKSTLAKLSNLEKKLKAEGIEIDFKSIVKYD